MGLRGSSGPDYPEGLQKGEIRNMNSLTGKSTGIALLMAAALLAALFAMGVFSAAGVNAAFNPNSATAVVDTPDPGAEVEITITFTVDSDIDGLINNVAGDEDVTIDIPIGDEAGEFVLMTGVTVPNVTVKQLGSDVGTVTVTANSTETITISGDTSITNPVEQNRPVTVVVTGLKNPTDTATNVQIALEQGGTGIGTDPDPIDIYGSISGQSAMVSPNTPNTSGVTMTLEFTPGEAGADDDVTITLPIGYDLGINSDAEDSLGDNHKLTATGLIAADGQDISTEAQTTTDPPVGSMIEIPGERLSVGMPVRLVIGPADATETVTNPTGFTNPPVDDFTVSFQAGVTGALRTALTSMFSVAEAPGFEQSIELSPDPAVASDPVRIELNVKADREVPPGEDLTIEMKGWGLPSNIPESGVLILGQGGTLLEPAYSGEPAEVRIEAGNKVILSLTSRYVNGDEAGPLKAGEEYSIVFKQSAGITNPSRAGGRYAIKVDDLDGSAATHTFSEIRIMSKVKLSKTAGPRGTQVEVTAVGLSPGDATFYLRRQNYDQVAGTSSPEWEDGDAAYNLPGYELDKAVASGGTAVVTIDTTTQNFIAGTRLNGKRDTLQGLNQIWAIDGAGTAINIPARFEVTPLIELDGDTFKRGGKVDITVSDWTYGTLDTVYIGAEEVTEVPRGSGVQDWADRYPNGLGLGIDEVEFSFIVPNNARLGEQELKLEGDLRNRQGSVFYADLDAARSTILIGAFDLTLEPSTAVTGQVIRIEGTGFEDNACIVQISIGGDVFVEESTSGNGVGQINDDGTVECSGANDNVETDSNGNLADTFLVPGNLKAGTYRVTVIDVQRRIGIADLTIPEPEIELEPAASQRGSNVVVIGSNFPAEDVITISYRGRTVTAANTDTVGRFRGTFPVPVNAPIGEEHEVEAISADKADGNPQGEPILKAKMLHRVPDEVLEVTPEVAALGTRITITASNLPLFTPVNVFIGSVLVAGSSLGELAESDGNGEWSGTPLVPQLTPGTHTVEMRVGRGATGISVSTFLEIADIITRSSDEAFADLIDNGTLTRVWYLEAATQTWSFFDPAPEFADFNTLTEVSTGQIVTIIMATQDEFQGRSLYVGSNNVAIE